MLGAMPLIAYLDEAGDHALDRMDADFPVFALSLLVFDTEHYASVVVPAVYRLKLSTWGHEAIILHSREIRKAQGAFWFLRHQDRRLQFYEQINAVVRDAEVQVFVAVVRKEAHRALHADRARNPYDLALRLTLERVLDLLIEAGQRHLTVVAEARGRREDAELRRAIDRLWARGTGTSPAARFRAVELALTFTPKAMNIVGTQLADLMAYPVARHVLQPEQPSPAFEVVEPKLCRHGGERIGPAVYPPVAATVSPISEQQQDRYKEASGPGIHQAPLADRENAQSQPGI